MISRPRARWITFLAAVVVALYLCWLMLEPFVDVVLWAAVLAIVAWPVHKKMLRRTGKPALSAGVTCLIVVATVLLPLTLVTLAIVKESQGLGRDLPGQVRRLLDPESAWIKKLDTYIDVTPLVNPEFVTEKLKAVSGAIASRTLGLVGGFLGIVVQVFFVLFTLFYLLRDRDKIVGALRDTVPLEPAQAEAVFARTEEVISASVYGVMVISAIQGTLGAIAFMALRLPSPLLWGVVMFLLSMVPMAGAAIVWAPAALFLALTGHWIKAILLTVWGALVIGMIDNVLRPRLVGEKTKLHELLIFFSVLGGLQVFGILGLVVGPVVLAIALALLEIFRQAEGGGDIPAPADLPAPPGAALEGATENRVAGEVVGGNPA